MNAGAYNLGAFVGRRPVVLDSQVLTHQLLAPPKGQFFMFCILGIFKSSDSEAMVSTAPSTRAVSSAFGRDVSRERRNFRQTSSKTVTNTQATGRNPAGRFPPQALTRLAVRSSVECEGGSGYTPPKHHRARKSSTRLQPLQNDPLSLSRAPWTTLKHSITGQTSMWLFSPARLEELIAYAPSRS